MYKIKLIVLLLLSITYFGCKKLVFEDRDGCSSYFRINLDNVSYKDVDTLYMWYFGSDKILVRKDTLTSNSFGRDYLVEIKRDIIEMYVWGKRGKDMKVYDDKTLNSALVKGYGGECDSLYYYRSVINTRRDFSFDTIRLFKEFATLNVSFKTTPQENDSIWIAVESNIMGEYIDTRPYRNRGEIIVNQNVNFIDDRVDFSFRIGRQHPNLSNLEAKVYVRREGVDYKFFNIPLEEWLRELNYDFYAVSLEDIWLSVDVSMGFATIKVKDWVVVKSVKIEI